METTRTTEGPVAQDGRRIRRVYRERGQGWPPEDRWQLCRRCGARTLRGYLRCSQCGESLRDKDERPRFHVLGEYTDRVSEGEDVGAVSDYLHQQGYLAGPQVDTALRRRRRRQWRRLRRARGRTAAPGEKSDGATGDRRGAGRWAEQPQPGQAEAHAGRAEATAERL